MNAGAAERGRRRYHRSLGEAPARWWNSETAAAFIAKAHDTFPGSVEVDKDGEPLPPEQLSFAENSSDPFDPKNERNAYGREERRAR